MYIDTLELNNFKSFEKETISFNYPDSKGRATEYPNVNLLLGLNSSGKTSILRAGCIAMLSEMLPNSGFQVRNIVRQGAKEAKLTTKLVSTEKQLEINVRVDDKLGVLIAKKNPKLAPLWDDQDPAFFLSAYAAGRWVSIPNSNSEMSIRNATRRPRYQRVASLFEDNYSLIPPEYLKNMMIDDPQKAGFFLPVFHQLLNLVGIKTKSLPHTDLSKDPKERDELLFDVNGTYLPFHALADGYRSFVSWVSDMLYHFYRVNAPVEDHRSLKDPKDFGILLSGVVMIDEVDLHLHANLQKDFIHNLSKTFPNIQFIFTSHSPLIAGSLPAANTYIVENENGLSKIRRPDQEIRGLDADQILLTPYFGLQTTRNKVFRSKHEDLRERAVNGDKEARLELLQLYHTGAGEA